MKFGFFSVSENGENGLGDERADGGNPSEFLGYGTVPCTENAVLVKKPNTFAFYHMKYTQPARA